MKLTLAYSPCPNDTFMFCDLATGTASPEYEIEVQLHDVETLNRLALKGAFDVSKVSFATALRLRGEYELLNVGAALGFGCGPVAVSRRKNLRPDDLADCRVAVPGELTTAHLLLQLWAPQARNKLFVRYDQVIPMVARGEAECGIIIHEGRFVYQQAGLRCVMDLGAWWEEETKLPIPLGGIVARSSLGSTFLREFEATLRRAIEHSVANPEHTWDYVRRHAQEMDPDVLKRHVKMFVNEFSLDLGAQGRAAVEELERRARDAGVIG